MGNNKGLKKCRRCGKIAVKGKRHCEYCLTHRICSYCKQELHISEFNKTIEGSLGNLGRCKKCEDLRNYKKCFGCKQTKHRNEFAEKSSLCLECKNKSEKKYKIKYGFRECTICKTIKNIEEFDYLMKTCKVCSKGRKSIIQKKSMLVIHCRYCNEITNNKTRICDKCLKVKKCDRCKQIKNKSDFGSKKNVCLECIEKQVNEKKNKTKFLVKQTCSCGVIDEVFSRFRKPKKSYVCSKCQKEKDAYYDSLPGNFSICHFCNKKFMFLSAAHILKCSNKTYTLDKYKKEFGKESIYSEKYRFVQRRNSKIASNTIEVKNKISLANKEYFKTHRDEVLKRTEKMRNSPKRIEAVRENFKNMSVQQHERRITAAKKSWTVLEIRKNRLQGIRNSEKSQLARKRNIRICLQKEQQIVSKPAKALYDFLIENNFNVKLEYLVRFYHIDIAEPTMKLCIEVDGDWWHGNSKFYPKLNKNQKKRQDDDRRKETYLINRGWKILRYWQSDLLQGFDKVLEDVNTFKMEYICCQQKQKIA